MSATVSTMRLHRVEATSRTTWFVVEVLTSEGLVGVGECSDSGRDDDVPLEVPAAFELIADVDLTADVTMIDCRLWEWAAAAVDLESRFARGTVAGGIVTAVCDILAQADGVPLWKWLGGERRTTVPLYANINRSAGRRRADDFARVAAQAVSDGFDAVKLAPFDGANLWGASAVERGVSRVRAVRAAVGDDVRVLVDFHHRLAKAEVSEALPALEELGVGWLEDVVDVRSADDLAWLAMSTSIPLAGGERIVDPDVLSAAVAGGYLGFLLLDPKYVGGPLRLRQLLELVENVVVTFHNPTGPIATAAAVHLCTLHPDVTVLEYAYGEKVDRAAMIEPAEHVAGGEIAVPMEPGLGVQLCRDALPAGATWEWTV